MARRLAGAHGLSGLSLDDICWDAGPRRKPLEVSIDLLCRFIRDHPAWVIEGCYGDLIEVARPFCTELRFLNPGMAACVANCRRRPWEPDKFPTPHAQNAMLEALIEWACQYETRQDEYGLTRHRRIFEAFTGPKREYAALTEMD